MKHAAFEQPLTDEQLRELGRLVVNCGFAEFLLNFHAGMLFRLSGSARMDLVAPLATRRKIEIIEARLDEIPRPKTRRLVGDAVKLIGPTIHARNYLLHGIWGMDGPAEGSRAVVVSPKNGSGHKRAEDISLQADRLAESTQLLAVALAENSGETAKTHDRLVIKLG